MAPEPDPQRVREVFDAARGLSGDARASFVAEACGADASLRREVEELLEHLYEIPTAFVGDDETSADGPKSPATDHLAAGTVVGNYTIERVIGEGGMGIVYLARQERPKRTVALKLIRSGWASERMLGRFRRETELLGRLQHSGIAQIYEAGMAETAHGERPFFAMEYVQGRGLLEYAAFASLGTRDRLRLLALVCDAVEHAHQRGIIHRDLKPANILVTADGRPKILDFGVARATDSDLQVTTVQTDVGQLIGTVPYMSPEQASGHSEAFDARSDVYALGVVTYQLLAGRLPYELSGKMLHEAVRVIHEEEPTPLSSLDRSLRGDVETIVSKALEKEPQRRYQSAADLRADIDRYLADEPITARPPSTVYQLRKFARRNKALVGGVAATFVVLLAGVIVSTTLALGQAEARREAEARLEESEAVMEFLSDAFTAPQPQAAGYDVTAKQVVDSAAELLDGRFEEHPIAGARARYTIAATYRQLSEHRAALPLLEEAHATQSSLLGPEDPSTLDTGQELAEVYRLLGRMDESRALFEETVAALERVFGPTHRRTILGKVNLVNLYDDIPKDYGRAAAMYLEIIGGLEKVIERGPAKEAPWAEDSLHTCLMNLGVLRVRQGDLDDAESLYLRADALSQGGDDLVAPRRATLLVNLGSLYLRQGRPDDAEPVLREALEIGERVQGPDHEGTVITRLQLARLLTAREQLAEAEPLLRASIDPMERIYGEAHPRPLITQSDLAEVLRKRGKLSEAAELNTAVLERARSVLPEGHWFIGAFLIESGRGFLALERYAEAESSFREAHEIYVAQFGEQHARIRSPVRGMIDVFEATGDAAQAEAWRAKLPPAPDDASS